MDSVLSQRGASVEIIVLDDGSTIPLPGPVIEQYAGRVRFEVRTHAGKGASINAAAQLANAEFLCILDQDDLMLEGRLARQLAVLRADARIDGAYSDYERRDEQGRLIDTVISRQADGAQHLRACALGCGLVSMQTLILRREFFVRLGGFSDDPALSGLDDAEFFARLFAADAKLRYVPGLFGSWTSHPENYSKSAAFQEARLSLLEHLSALAAEHPILRPALPLFAHHARLMRGLYLLEHGRPAPAAGEFQAALNHRWTLNAFYLLCKSRLC